MNLTDLIKEMGTAGFAKRYGIPVRTAEAYRQRRRIPRGPLADKIVRSSSVTWEGIYRPAGETPPARRGRPPKRH